MHASQFYACTVYKGLQSFEINLEKDYWWHRGKWLDAFSQWNREGPSEPKLSDSSEAASLQLPRTIETIPNLSIKIVPSFFKHLCKDICEIIGHFKDLYIPYVKRKPSPP